MFAPSCISHTVITKPDWLKVEVEGVNLPDAIQCWVSQTFPGEQSLGYDADFIAEKYNLVTAGDYLRPAMMADSPQQGRFRLNSNLVRSMDREEVDRPGGEVDRVPKYTNTMSHRISRARHKQNLIDNRTKRKRGGGAGGRGRGPCGAGDTLENRVKCVQQQNQRFLLENQVGTRNNRDLVRSLDTAGTSRRRRRRNRERKIRLSGMEGLSKEERRSRRREERRRLKELEKKERKARRREEKRKRKELKRREEEGRRRREEEMKVSREDEVRRSRREEEARRRSRRDVLTCSTKHIDRCSWPQCNRSCPKLHNPITGR